MIVGELWRNPIPLPSSEKFLIVFYVLFFSTKYSENFVDIDRVHIKENPGFSRKESFKTPDFPDNADAFIDNALKCLRNG